MSLGCEPQVERHENGCMDRVNLEIRRAANSFLGITELLLESPLTLEQRDYVEVLRSATDRLLSVTGRVVRMTGRTSEEGAACAEFNLRETVVQTASLMAILGAADGVQVIPAVAGAGPWRVTGDKQQFEQILVSIVAPLMKSCSRSVIRIVVDRGEGDKIWCKITAPIAALAGKDTAGDLVADLSMEVAETEVRSSGGTFSVSQTADHTVVACTIPLPDVYPNPTDVAPKGEATTPALCILLVEDSPENQFVIRAYVKGNRYSLDSVDNGIAAVQKAKRGIYSLILMDIEMPGMSGIEAMKAIRAWEVSTGRNRIPIIALTAHAEDAAKTLAAGDGFTAYLSKPVRKQTVLATLDRYAVPADARRPFSSRAT
jgi:CheY-like chemotaxis protein